MVIGTTGFNEAQRATIADAPRDIAIVMAPNMSVGVNVALKLIDMATRALAAGCDIEIVESHHRDKVDAPSGTALQMGEVIAAGAGQSPVRRRGPCAPRPHRRARSRNRSGFSAIRGGDIVGDHTVLFAGTGERIEITHRSTSRANYAQGSLRAARFLAGRPPGLYDMDQVLGLDGGTGCRLRGHDRFPPASGPRAMPSRGASPSCSCSSSVSAWVVIFWKGWLLRRVHVDLQRAVAAFSRAAPSFDVGREYLSAFDREGVLRHPDERPAARPRGRRPRAARAPRRKRGRGPERGHGALQVDVDAAQQPALPEDHDPGAHGHEQEQDGDAPRDGIALGPEAGETGHGRADGAPSPRSRPST